MGLLCAAALAAAILSGRPGAVPGVAVGLAVGGLYAGSLLGGMRRLSRLGPMAALRWVQIGSVVRLALVVAGFALAARLLPSADLGWAAAATLLPILWSLVRAAHEGAHMS